MVSSITNHSLGVLIWSKHSSHRVKRVKLPSRASSLPHSISTCVCVCGGCARCNLRACVHPSSPILSWCFALLVPEHQNQHCLQFSNLWWRKKGKTLARTRGLMWWSVFLHCWSTSVFMYKRENKTGGKWKAEWEWAGVEVVNGWKHE